MPESRKYQLQDESANRLIGELLTDVGVPDDRRGFFQQMLTTVLKLHEDGADIGDLKVTTRQFTFRYRSAEHFIEVFRDYCGPVHKAFLALPAEQQQRLDDDLRELIARFSRGGDTMVVSSDYLEAVITRA